MSSNGKKTSGILRIDTHEKPRRLSGSSVEFKLQPELLGYEVTIFYSDHRVIKCHKLKSRLSAIQNNPFYFVISNIYGFGHNHSVTSSTDH